ncbi:putative PAS/PAC sensor protein [Methanolacinia petrolearia DSM 11571]|uniref:Putative PAS/PAC sensor protein n=1 Tax=Methanolacinia petrolearia (strain DSM 11571 / OCM 486 / SEBR 4847) TaxID=679926 RepID=E1RD35_METP4|nr:PAS domain S-box protein [Methanolacinia petrolearia]ADN35935.1 putative PAS/PAC sensor protein [Methanolacinia petrolearia DSM 11571]
MAALKKNTKTTETISVLYIDESSPIPEKGRLVLKEKGSISVEACESEKDALRILSKKKFDAIVAGCITSGCNGTSFISRLRESGDETPVIIFTPKGHEDNVISTLNSGADYYIQRDGDPETLYAGLSEKINQLVIKRKKKSIIRSFFYSNSDVMFVKDENLRYLIANNAALDFFGVGRDELSNRTDRDLLGEKNAETCHMAEKKALKTGRPVFTEENIGNRYLRCMKFPLEISPGRTGIGAIVSDITEKRQIEEKLKQHLKKLEDTQKKLKDNEEYIKNVLDGIPVGIAVLTLKPEIGFVYYNQNFLKYHRISEKALENIDAFWENAYEDPVFREEIKKKVLTEIETGGPERMQWYEVPVTRSGGETTYINMRNIPLDKKGQIISMVWDVTEQKKVNDKNRLHLERLKWLLDLYRISGGSEENLMLHALENSRSMTESKYGFIGVLTADESEMIVYQWSKDVMKRCEVQATQKHLPIKSAGIWAECVRKRAPVIVNEYSQDNPGKRGLPKGHVEISRILAVPIFDSGKITAIIIVANKETQYCEDDTDALTTLGNLMWEILKTRRAEDELIREKELFSQTFESLRDAAFVLDAHPLSIRKANKAASKLFEYSIKEMTGKKPDLLHVDGDSVEQFTRQIHSYLTGHTEMPRFEFRMKRKDGTVFPAEHSISSLYDSGGNQKGWVHIVRDITSEKEAEMREKASLRQIEENMEQLATLNDQIRNPLAVILGLADLKCPESAKEITDQVKEIDKMVKMLDEGWVRSEKIWAYLKTHYGLGKID